MAMLGEREMSFELIESLLKYIKSLQIPGGVLIFLPGIGYNIPNKRPS
jgi:ATP-dependent RNA helicase A